MEKPFQMEISLEDAIWNDVFTWCCHLDAIHLKTLFVMACEDAIWDDAFKEDVTYVLLSYFFPAYHFANLFLSMCYFGKGLTIISMKLRLLLVSLAVSLYIICRVSLFLFWSECLLKTTSLISILIRYG